MAFTPSRLRSTPMAFKGKGGHAFVAFAKIDKERREVWGIAQVQDAKPDTQGDVVDFDASIRAFKNWAGNVREMHGSTAAGRAIAIIPEPESKSIYVGVHVSKGAEDTWQKILDGTLQGFSIGGNVVHSHFSVDKATGKRVQYITDYSLDELSLVDSPANARCKITAVYKQKGHLIAKSVLGKIGPVHKTLADIVPRTAADLVRQNL